MAETIRYGDCVKIPDGRIGRVRDAAEDMKYVWIGVTRIRVLHKDEYVTPRIYCGLRPVQIG
jgi:protein involved in temperature-dependent protein secretion